MTSFVVSAGIVSSGNTLNAAETGIVLAGGTVVAASATAGGKLTITGGGSASAAVASAGGAIQDAGRLSGASVGSGGLVQVVGGGVAVRTYADGGTVAVQRGGTVRNTHLRNGATLEVQGGGTAIGALVTSGTIEDAGRLVSAHINGGVIRVLSGGVASAVSANDAAGAITRIEVQRGGLLSGFALSGFSGDTLEVAGIAIQGTLADDWAMVQVSSGGAISGLTAERPFGMNVFSGGVMSGLTVDALGWVGVNGTLEATLVASGGNLEIFQDPSSLVSGLTVLAGGAAEIFFRTTNWAPTALPLAVSAQAGASLVAMEATVAAGQTMRVAPLTHAFSAAVFDGLAGATEADWSQVQSGGAVLVAAGALVADTRVYDGGRVTVFSGGASYYEDVYGGGVERVLSGARDIWGAVHAGGTLLNSGGIVSALALVGGGASATVFSGGIAVGGLVAAGTLAVADGGEAVGTMLNPSPYFANDFSPALMLVASGGSALVTAVGEGTLWVTAGGVATSTGVGVFVTSVGAHHAAMTVAGVANSVTVSGGTRYADATALLRVQPGGVARDVTVGVNGTVIDDGRVSALHVGTGGVADVTSGGLLSGASIEGGVLRLDDGSVTLGGIAFAGSGGELVLSGTVGPQTAVSGFAPGDVVDLRSIAFTSAVSARFLPSNVLQVTSGAVALNVRFDHAQDFGGEVFRLGGDGAGGTEVTLAASAAAPAWAGGMTELVVSGGGSWAMPRLG